MTTLLLCLFLYGLLMFAAGMRFTTAVREQRDGRRGGYVDLIGRDL